MPQLSKLYPSKYLSAPDLKGKKATVTITEVGFELFDDDGKKVEKPIAYFKEGKKGLVLNKTNALTIANIAGETDTDNWPGVRVTLYPTMVQFGGKVTDAIRIEKPIPADAPVVGAVPKPIPPDTPPKAAVEVIAEKLDDDIPW